MRDRVRWVVRVIRELDRALEHALRARSVDRVPPPRSQEDDERELRVCRDTLRAAMDAVEDLSSQLQHEALRYRELVEFVPAGYLETDREGVIRRANASAARLLRQPDQVLYGKPLVAFVVECDFPAFLQHQGAMRTPQTAVSRIITLQPQDAEPLRASISVGALCAKAGEVTGFRCMLRALDER